MTKTPIITTIHGSNLFGTTTKNSDIDRKSVILPNKKDILLGNINQSKVFGAAANKNEKNKANDEDFETHDVSRFITLLTQGQPVALEMLFTPEKFYLQEPHAIWNLIKQEAPKFLSKDIYSFVGYCRRQANVYSVKGERLNAAKNALTIIIHLEKTVGAKEKIGPYINDIVEYVNEPKYVKKTDIIQPNNKFIEHLEVCDKKAPFSSLILEVRKMVERIVNEYGKRANNAAEENGSDWKAISHAVRIANEAIEFLSSGFITLPRPEAEYLTDIKLGKIDKVKVYENIDELFEKIEIELKNSKLPEKSDIDLAQDLIATIHLIVINSDEIKNDFKI